MHLSVLVGMIASSFDDRELLGASDSRCTGATFGDLARRGASTLIGAPTALIYVGENHPLLPIALFSAAWAGIPYVPINYRLEDGQLNELVARQPGALVLADASTAPRIVDAEVAVFDDWLQSLSGTDELTVPVADDEDDVAVVLFTSGTTSTPKSVLLRHRHLMSYLLSSGEFGSASEDESMLVSVPPYHVAGLANMLSSLFAGRRLVYLERFDPNAWLDAVREEKITTAMVVPTMLSRIVDALDGRPADAAGLKSLRYGGAKVAERVVRDALRLFPTTGFVNAYGLTETAATITVLGPDEHRSALDSDDPDERRRMMSAGRPLPTIELEIRDEHDQPLGSGHVGLVHARGPQIAGEYASGSALDADGWFCTRDLGWIDTEGYLYVEGRADDTIIRGGENIAPAEIEDVLLGHPAIAEACVVGRPDDEWGEQIVAAVVLRSGSTAEADELKDLVRGTLRGSKTPGEIIFVDSIPHTDTGKMLRRAMLQNLTVTHD